MNSDSILSNIGTSSRKRVHIIIDRCKECGLCIITCPKGLFTLGEARNKKGFRYPAIRNLHECLFCKLCEYTCPELAIYVS